MASRLCEQLHFYRCRPYLSLDNLVDLNMDTIRIFVLAAFYMLCACNRNMGYMYLDLAARAAHTLGLHHVGFEGILNEEEKATRAFVFSASLILGLILFTDENAARDVRRSLTNAIEVMRKISGRSRQAEHYLFILRDMQTDIERFQERQATSRRESSHRPVKRLMQQSAAQGSSPFVDGSDLLLARSSSGSTGASGSGGMTAFPFSSTMFSDAENGASTWNFPHIQFWDDLSAFGTG
ncbi:hypothetical protein H2200_009536 [Cladophialophora chaetospira]|uniref:Xylanolytic transcriptional activator regulatory domain-containing protein n=1 Tax=Cladophialophora chaetospira TaxID=386627 RepID=A0AA38X2X8_9EURO|nr:hypothetical protein H2200_009536 [Cladophialophora chaetospira]